ncbi:Num1p LALA0_S03e02476g [Lachancea lanzarotensis]|uniref:LALA0S03e02476g1_1 n=1 Tax=Lachancea lanzarotensis TaxID=1245769 RepID=A0A0C7N480_9SACH|nr:uncharacterized protein LALA0_S03e02476g [Lachancea lanzarotensis]CEP61421.1 LALA0S03e02476g1_1 [Lachancea lanzarotensis]
MPQFRGQGKKSRDSDLRSQLEDMQRRIDHETEEALSKRDSKKHAPFSNILSKRDKRMSMPVFAGSSTHNNVVNSDSSKDVNFMVGLSENLLMECRRLQAENEKKSLRLKSLQQEYESLNSKFNTLSAKFQGTQQEGLSLKDTNWELETKLQEITEELKELKDSSERTKKELHSKMSMCRELQNKFDETNFEKQGLEMRLADTQQESAADLAGLKKNILELNEENDDLQRKVEAMSSEIRHLTEKHEKAKEPESLLANKPGSSGSRALSGAGLNETQVPSKEPIDGRLAEAHIVIEKLKQQIFHLQKTQKVNTSQDKISKEKAVRNREFTSDAINTSFGSTPHSTTTPVDNSIDSIEVDRSFNYSSDNDSVGDVTDTMDVPRNPILDDLSYDEGHSLEIEDVKRFADSHDLVLLSQKEYKSLQPIQKGIEKEALAGKHAESQNIEPSEEVMIARLQKENYVIYDSGAHREIERILSHWESPPSEYLEEKTMKLGKHIISAEEYKSFKSPTLATLIKRIAEFDYIALPTNELETLRETAENPSQEFLERNLSNHNKVTVSSDLYKELMEPSMDSLVSRAKNAGCKLINSREWESTLDSLANPTLAYLSEAAEAREHTLITKASHENLLHPPLADVSRRAAELKHALLSEKDYETLNATDRASVEEKAGSIGLVVLTEKEHMDLLQPTPEQLNEKVESNGYHVIKDEQYCTLINPDADCIAQMAAKFDLECIASQEITELRRSFSDPDDAYLKAKGMERHLKVLEEHEYEKLVAESELPALEAIERSITTHYLEPLLDWLREEMNFSVLRREEYEELRRKAEDPSYDELQKVTHNRGQVMLTVDRYEKLSHSFERPGLDFLQNHCKAYDKVIIDQDKWSDVNTMIEHPTLNYLENHAKNKGLHLSDFDSLTTLENQIDKPGIDYLSSKCKALDFEMISAKDLHELRKNAEKPERSYLDSKLQLFGCVSIDSDELSRLQRQLQVPEKAYLDEKLKSFGYLAVDETELSTMKNQLEDLSAMESQLKMPKLPYLEDRAKELGFVIIQGKILSDLSACVEDPELSFLEEKLKKFNMVAAQIVKSEDGPESLAGFIAVKDEEYQAMIQSFHDPPQSYLELKLKSLGLEAVDASEYSELKNLRDHPKQNFLEEKLAKFGLFVIQREMFSQLSVNGEKADLESLRQEAKVHGLAMIDQGELDELKEAVTSPRMSFLEDRLNGRGLMSMSKSEYKELTQAASVPDMAEITTILEERNLIAVEVSEHSKLKKHVEVPELVFLKEKLEEKGFTAIKENELDVLRKNALNPPTSLMEERLKDLGYHVMTVAEYKRLEDSVENPTLTFLHQKASDLDLLLVPEVENRKMVEMLNEPPLDYIQSKIKGYTLLPTDEVTLLRATATSPSLEFLTSESEKCGYTVIKTTEKQELINKAQSPSLSEVRGYAKNLKAVVLTDDEFQSMQDIVKNPSESFISEKAAAIGLTVLSENEYTTILAASEQEAALQKIEKSGMKVIPEEEYLKLRDGDVNNATIEKLESQLAKFGNAMISVTDLENLKRPLLERLDDALVLEFCEKRNLVMVSQQELASLKDAISKPSESVVEACAAKSGKVLLSRQEFDVLKEEAHLPPLETLQRGSEKLNLVLVDKSIYQNMMDRLANPSLEWLEVQVGGMGKILLDKAHYDELAEISENPSIEYLGGKVAQQDHCILSLVEHQNLRNQGQHPDESYIKEKASGMGMATVDVAELEDLKRREAYPELDELELKVQKLGKAIVSREQIDLLESPSPEYLKCAAEKNGLVLVENDEYTELRSFEDRISTEDLARIASRLSCSILPNADLEKMRNNIKEPSLEFLSSKAASYEKTVIDTEELHALKDDSKKLSDPTPEFVALLASAMGHILIDKMECEEMRATIAKPGQDYLNMKANDVGFALVDKVVYEKQLSTLDSPSIHHLKEKANKLQCEVVLASLWEQFSTTADRPTLEFLEKKVGLYPDHLIISVERLEALKSAAGESSGNKNSLDGPDNRVVETAPTPNVQIKPQDGNLNLNVSDIYDAAKSFGLAVMPAQELESLLEKLESVTQVASSKKLPLSDLRDTFGNRLQNDTASSIRLSRTVTDSSDYFDALQSEPNDSIINGAFDVSSAYYTDALSNPQLSRASTLSKKDEVDCISKIHEQARLLGFVLVKEDAVGFEDLSSVQDNTFCHGSAAPAIEGTSNLFDAGSFSDEASTMSSSEDENALKKRAAKLGLVIITEDEHAQFMTLKTLQTEKARQESTRVSGHASEDDGLLEHVYETRANVVSSIAQSSITGGNHEPESQVTKSTSVQTDEKAGLGSRSIHITHETVTKQDEPAYRGIEDNMSKIQSHNSSDSLKEGSVAGSSKERENRHSYSPSVSYTWKKAELIEKAHEFGLVSLEAEQFALIKEELAAAPKTLTLDDLMIKAAEFDLVPIQKKQFEQIKDELSNPSLTKEQVLENATVFGLVAVDKEEFERLTSRKSRSEDDELTSSGIDETELSEDNEDKLHLDALAKKLGLMCVPESAFVATTSAGGMDPQNVVVLPSTYYDYILAKDQEGLKMATNEELQMEAKKRGLAFNGKSSSTQSHTDASPQRFRISRQSTIRSNLSSESSNRRTLAEAAANAAYNDYDMVTIRSRGGRTSMSSGRQPILSAEVGVPHIRQTSFDGGISLATVASLSEPSIIPALTQTVIGEYLYKYYRRLGPISNVSSRHERYFWVHPYTLTLYWSTNNPVLGNPATNKTRAAAILGVESVDDPNPYPVGLYHKSIVIKTETRSVKITCATRQRHNIWFNSLRYLIQRSMDGIELDDPAADSTDTNKIYQLPGETPQLTNQRLSSTRRGYSAGSAKRSASSRTLRP